MRASENGRVAGDRAATSACHVGGQGSELVLLHGLGGTWEVWRPVLTLLEARHRVIALTLPGHHGGPVFAGRGDATVAALADQVLATLREQGLTSAHVAGNSLGGWLALELARRGFARSVVAFSPAGGWRSRVDYRAVATPLRIVHAVAGLVRTLVRPFVGSAWLRKVLTKQTMERGERMPAEALLAALRAMSQTRVLPGLLRSMGRDGPILPLAAGGVPICIAWSECDRVIPYPRYGAPLVERIAGAQLRSVTGAGHVPMFDDPQQVVGHILAVTGRVDAAVDAAAAA